MLAAKLYALSNWFNTGFTGFGTIGKFIRRKLKTHVFTGSKTFFNYTFSQFFMAKKTNNRYLLFKRSIQKIELNNLSWIKTENNIADALTKNLTKRFSELCSKTS